MLPDSAQIYDGSFLPCSGNFSRPVINRETRRATSTLVNDNRGFGKIISKVLFCTIIFEIDFKYSKMFYSNWKTIDNRGFGKIIEGFISIFTIFEIDFKYILSYDKIVFEKLLFLFGRKQSVGECFLELNSKTIIIVIEWKTRTILRNLDCPIVHSIFIAILRMRFLRGVAEVISSLPTSVETRSSFFDTLYTRRKYFRDLSGGMGPALTRPTNYVWIGRKTFF